uniref:Pantoate-activating enzyme n=1 Tax=Arcella intermedia TaxID=1963864 RepID=A0A6B2LQ83_9EUKA
MIRDMNFPVQLEIVPTMREADGLAMSSRNRYLSPEQRKLAPILYQALLTAKNLVEKEQVYSRGPLVDSALRVLEQPGVTVDYISLASLEDGREIDLITNKHPLLLSGAIKIGTTRLIDNLIAQPL